MSARKPRAPRWVWPTIVGVTVGVVGLLWAFSLYDDHGSPLIDAPGAMVLVGLFTAVSSVLVVILQRTRTADHELQPNSGSSAVDKLDRIEGVVQDLARAMRDVVQDVGGIREENRIDRRSAADDRRAAEERDNALENRLTLIEQKETRS